MTGTQSSSPRTSGKHPNYATYIVLRKVGRNNAVSYCPSTEDLMSLKLAEVNAKLPKPSMQNSPTFGCKHFPEGDENVLRSWSCEFCRGARLIEQAARDNAALVSLDFEDRINEIGPEKVISEAEQSPKKSLWTVPNSLSNSVALSGASSSKGSFDSSALDSVVYERMENLSISGSSTGRGPETPWNSSHGGEAGTPGTPNSSCEWSSDCIEISEGHSGGCTLSWNSSSCGGPPSHTASQSTLVGWQF